MSRGSGVIVGYCSCTHVVSQRESTDLLQKPSDTAADMVITKSGFGTKHEREKERLRPPIITLLMALTVVSSGAAGSGW